MITVHQYPLSPFNQKIRRQLNHKGVPFQERLWAMTERRGVLRLSPSGKLPALEHDGRVICDSTDIAHYIEAEFPQRPLIPADPAHRAMVHVLEDWADESLYFYEMHLRFVTPGNRERNVPRLLACDGALASALLRRILPGVISKTTAGQGVGRKTPEQLETDLRRHLDAAEALLANGGWLVGGELSLADLAVYSMLVCLRDVAEAAPLLADHPGVTAWLERVETETSDELPA